MNNNLTISIIIPIYNTANYLSDCIDSVLSQTFTNFELLLINDGSLDDSGKICDEYASRDSRIQVIHKSNGGVSTARNVGLENATGKWCCFIDSDDWVDVDYLNNFIKVMNNETQLILQGFWMEFEDTHISAEVHLLDKIVEHNYELVQWLENAKKVHNGFLWHRLFRMDIINKKQTRFIPGISFAEDGWFFFQYLKEASHFVMTSALGYHYRIRKGSLTSTGKIQSPILLERVFRGYIETLYSFKVPEEVRMQHTYFVRRYMWRLALSWFVERSYNDLANKNYCIHIMQQLIQNYQMDKLENSDISLLLLSNVIRWQDSNKKNMIIRCLLFYRKYKQKIASHL